MRNKSFGSHFLASFKITYLQWKIIFTYISYPAEINVYSINFTFWLEFCLQGALIFFTFRFDKPLFAWDKPLLILPTVNLHAI